MSRRASGPVALAALAVALLTISSSARINGQIYVGGPPAAGGQWAAQPSTKNGEWPHYNGDIRGTRYSPLDQINASNFSKLEVAWRFKTDNLGPRPGIQARRDAAHGEGRAVHDRRHTPVGDRARRENRRNDLDAQPARGQTRRRVAAPALRPRRLVLDRRPRRRAHHLLHDRLPSGRAQREDRRADQLVRHRRRRRSEGRRVNGNGSRSISRPAKSASTRRRPSPRTS